MKTFVMGDPHGGYKAYLQCIKRSKFNYKKDKLILLGDVADGWSQVPELIEELLKIKNLISITGNHDYWAYEWLKFGITPNLWLKQGGKATFDAYIKRHPDLMEKHRIKFFEKQVNYYIDDQNRGFVHGGFVSRKGLGHDAHQSNYFWDRDLWTLALIKHSNKTPELFLENSSRFEKHKEVFIGHTTTGLWNIKKHYPEYNDPNQAKNGRITVPMNRCNVWNLDTGGGFEGKLTIMDIDTKEYWQSDFVKDLYSNEKGRQYENK